MEKIVSSQDAPERFGALLQGVSDKGDRYVIERDGVPLAVVIPFALYSRWAGRREDFFARISETAERVNVTEPDAIRLTDEAKCAVRARP